MMRIRGLATLSAAALLAGPAAAADIELPDQLAWTAYDTGSAGYNQAVAIGSALKNELDVDLRVLPGKNDVSRNEPLRQGKVPFSATGFGDSWTGLINGQVDAAFAATNSGRTYELEASPRGIHWPPLPHDDEAGWERLRNVAPFFQPNLATIGAGMSEDNPYEGERPDGLDVGQRRLQRLDRRRGLDPGHGALGLSRAHRGRNRGLRLDRRRPDAAGDGRHRLHHGVVSRPPLAAAVPSLLYYFGLFVKLDAYAARHGLKGLPRTELLAAAPLHAIAFSFTSSSYVRGAADDLALKTRLEARTGGVPVVVTVRRRCWRCRRSASGGSR